MKKITLLLLAIALFTSCLKRADQHDYRTAYGATLLYEGTSVALRQNELILLAVEMDIVAEAPAEERDYYADLFFPYFKFRTEDNVYSLSRDGEVYFEMKTDGKSLIEPGAVWTVTKSGRGESTGRDIKISCITPNSWSLEIKEIRQSIPLVYNSQLSSLRADLTTSPRRSKFEVSFDNSMVLEPRRELKHTITTIPNEPLIVAYDLETYTTRFQPVSYYYEQDYSPFQVIGGDQLLDEFINPATKKADEVEAIFGEGVDISYGGFTETWVWSSIPYYNNGPCC